MAHLFFLCSEYNVMCLCRHLKLKFCICFKGEKDESCKEYYNAISSCFPIERYEFTIVWIILWNIHLKVIWRHCFGCSKLANLVLKTSRSILLASEGSFTLLRQTRVTYNQIFNKSSFCLAQEHSRPTEPSSYWNNIKRWIFYLQHKKKILWSTSNRQWH